MLLLTFGVLVVVALLVQKEPLVVLEQGAVVVVAV
jgi:hypothetical protein